MYADDIKLYTSLSMSDDPHTEFQTHLNMVAQWAKEWQLPIAHAKCCDMKIWKTNRIGCPLHLEDKIISEVNQCMDLGLLVDNTLQFTNHIDKMVVKAHRCANLILRCFQSRNRDSLLAGFKAYVRSTVEYNSVVWSPHLIKDIEAVEKVQRRFTKRLPGLSNLTYCQRLTKLNIDSLELRRIRADLIFMYKIVFGILDSDCEQFVVLRKDDNTRGHHFKLYLPISKHNARYNFFSHRTARIWNRLPLETGDFNSLPRFKKCLNSSMLVPFCKVNFF